MLEELITITTTYRLQRREIQNGRDSSPWAELWTTLWRERRQAFTDGAHQFAKRPKTGKQSSLLLAEKSEAGG